MPRTVTERADVLPALSEVFREHGFEGASLALIGQRTGLGKGSLYHFFPGGKEEMAAAVLAEIDGWFEAAMFRPLREEADPRDAIRAMSRSLDSYFRSGCRVCLVGAFALGDVRDRFATAIRSYFAAWIEALAQALVRAGRNEAMARDRAEEAVAAIQGALVLARALDDTDAFQRSLARIEARLLAV
jgi:TetR/AcrR family transcriptional repressor of lmrAB and yxaGH operons